jgi:hypothetical protein
VHVQVSGRWLTGCPPQLVAAHLQGLQMRLRAKQQPSAACAGQSTRDLLLDTRVLPNAMRTAAEPGVYRVQSGCRDTRRHWRRMRLRCCRSVPSGLNGAVSPRRGSGGVRSTKGEFHQRRSRSRVPSGGPAEPAQCATGGRV